VIWIKVQCCNKTLQHFLVEYRRDYTHNPLATSAGGNECASDSRLWGEEGHELLESDVEVAVVRLKMLAIAAPETVV
jgi:hypothetical protein